MTSTTPERVITVLRDYMASWGVIKLVVTDNGAPFNSTDFKSFLHNNGVHLTIAPDHPRSNGAAEVMVGIIKSKLQKMMLSGLPIEEATQTFLLDYRSTKHETTGKSPAELHLNRQIATRFDVLLQRKWQQEIQNNPGKRKSELQAGDSVLIRQYRQPTKWVRGEVVRPVGAVMAEVASDEHGTQRRHADQLIPIKTQESLEISGTEMDMPREHAELEHNGSRRSERAKEETKRLITEI